MLGEANWCKTIDAYSQDGDEQMDKGDPISEKRPGGEKESHLDRQRYSKTLTHQIYVSVPYLWSSMSSICLLT